jgi:glycosyltransferase involved in cell wall biosynthesis
MPKVHRHDRADLNSEEKLKVLLVSIAPPHNDCGGRIVMHRHLVERNPFELHVASDADLTQGFLVHTPLRLPYLIHRLRKSRFGPRLAAWITDYENFVWPLATNQTVEDAIRDFKPHLLLVLADNSLSKLAHRSARKHGLPLAGLFLDWVPIMKGHFGHRWTRPALSRWFRRFYGECDLAFCTSDGMQEVLGPHPNSHVIYPMPGRHRVPEKPWPPFNGKFRLAYVGSVENFYGRMLCSLIGKIEATNDLEIIVVGPNADWPVDLLQPAKANGIYLGFKPPQEAAAVLAGADALLVVMSFEREHELFMRTSFTTKFLDYVAFGKPVILWGPDYCTPFRVAHKHGGAVAVNQHDANAVISACRQIAENADWREQLSQEARRLHQTLFNPDRLQEIFVGEIEKLVAASKK